MLLITDRPGQGRAANEVFAGGMTHVVGGAERDPGASIESEIVVCDVDLDAPGAMAETTSVLELLRPSRAVPLLNLARHGGERAMLHARAVGATVVLPPDVSEAQVLFTVRRLIERRRNATRRSGASDDVAMTNDIGRAGLALVELTSALRAGERIPTEGLERGSNAIIAAVSGHRLGAWLDVMHAYDDVTYQHTLLVAGFASALAIKLGLRYRAQRLVCKAALLHDVGKVRIPREIVTKPGRLTPAEMAIVRRHPRQGHAMLVRQGGFDARILDVVLHHHEFLDGTGYPDGLSGEAILPLVRLMTICDIYAALVERRPYKGPMPHDDALGVLWEMDGKLDRHLLGAFRSMMEHR